jgi:hypothetical protein
MKNELPDLDEIVVPSVIPCPYSSCPTIIAPDSTVIIVNKVDVVFHEAIMAAVGVGLRDK